MTNDEKIKLLEDRLRKLKLVLKSQNKSINKKSVKEDLEFTKERLKQIKKSL